MGKELALPAPQAGKGRALTSDLSLRRLERWASILGDPKLYTTTSPARILGAISEAEGRAMLKALAGQYRPATAAQIAGHLAALSLHYWRPDMTDAQMSRLVHDFCSDLSCVTERVLSSACRRYRTNPANGFFPTPGKLLALCAEDMREAALMRRGIDRMVAALDGEGDEPTEREEGRPRDFKTLMAGLTRRAQEGPGRPLGPRTADEEGEMRKRRSEALARRESVTAAAERS